MSGPNGLARLASATNATNESGVEAETQVGSGGASEWARAAELAEPEWASHSGVRSESIVCVVGRRVGGFSVDNRMLDKSDATQQ